ncbi:hypothetical protein O181_075972 [Austropuccinia psidii MF-1]|uniref:SET domain-containing protein n=1 Tax=Austropuccinia psidii MF-1 TaxID=1389203 RepID=A0A9Q3FDI8_9BASI|nr:hypothetical protein [Austropuccinia psidii MF-1]
MLTAPSASRRIGRSAEPCNTSDLGRWLADNGGSFHPSLSFSAPNEDKSSESNLMGTCVLASGPVDKNQVLVSCTIQTAITRQSSLDKIERLFNQIPMDKPGPNPCQNFTSAWLDRQVISLYLILTKLSIKAESLQSNPLQELVKHDETPARRLVFDLFSFHKLYVSLLPPLQELTTPLFWNEAEVEKLRFTDLYPSIMERKQLWTTEYEEMMENIRRMSSVLYDYMSRYLSCGDYLWACTIITSRSFSSSLLENLNIPKVSSQTTLQKPNSIANLDLNTSSKEPTPILLPGVDTLNHKRGTKVEWRLTKSHSGLHKVQIIALEDTINLGDQVFNNYGAKPTAELILGYGFALDEQDWMAQNSQDADILNPDDFYTIKLAKPQESKVYSPLIKSICDRFKHKTFYHFITKVQPIPPMLLAQLRVLVTSSQEEVDKLTQCLGDLLKAQTSSKTFTENFLTSMPPKLTWDNELNCLDCLRSMLDFKLEELNRINHFSDQESDWKQVRNSVKRMIQIYRQGQHDILFNALERLESLISLATEQAVADGFAISFDED